MQVKYPDISIHMTHKTFQLEIKQNENRIENNLKWGIHSKGIVIGFFGNPFL